jgi:predicted dehydrogenase
MGCGVVADYGHIPAILQNPGLKLEAVFDPTPGRAAACANKFRVNKSFEDQEEFLNSGLDAVVVCSSAPAHPENVKAAARHDLHVLCEKPLALDDQEAEEMIAAMEAARKMLLVGFVYRFSPVAQQLKRWIEDGIIGEPKSLRLIYIWDLHGEYETSDGVTWIKSPRWVGRMEEGGPMIDCGVHMIDLARWWLGSEVESAAGVGAWVSDYAAPDHMYLHLEHARGEHTMVEMSFTYGHTSKYPAPLFTYDIIGTGGTLRYDRNGWLLEARTGDKHLIAPGASEKNFEGMYQAFAKALETEQSGDFPNGRDGLLATQIARRATDEAIAKRAISFPETTLPIPSLPRGNEHRPQEEVEAEPAAPRVPTSL